jgi:hypothetical protein
MGSNGITPNGAGTLVLVSPISIRTNPSILGVVPGFGTLTLTYVPEPGTLTLLGDRRRWSRGAGAPTAVAEAPRDVPPPKRICVAILRR